MAERKETGEQSELLELMRQRELRETRDYLQREQIRENEAKRRAEKLARMQAIWAQAAKTKAIRWGRCDHLRGKTGRGYKSLPAALCGLMINMHEFPDGTRRLKCEKCGMKWYKTDTREYLIRDGEKLPNPTGMSFEDVLKMYQEDDRDQTHFSRAMRFVPVAETSK